MFYTKWRMCIYKFHLRYTHIQTYEFVTQTLEHWSTYYYVLCAYIIKSTHTYTEQRNIRAQKIGRFYSAVAAAGSNRTYSDTRITAHNFHAYGCGQI